MGSNYKGIPNIINKAAVKEKSIVKNESSYLL